MEINPQSNSSDAASELNNLLQIISGTSALIEKGAKEGESPEQYLAMLRESIERAEKVAGELAQEAGGAADRHAVRRAGVHRPGPRRALVDVLAAHCRCCARRMGSEDTRR